MMRPRIVITLDSGQSHRKGVPFDTHHIKAAYVRAVERAGGTPILVAPTDDPDTQTALFDLADGVVITGGDFDIDPALFGETAAAGVRVDPPKPGRTRFEWALAEHALENDLPVLGICGGMQLLNVVVGGTLHLHIPDSFQGALEHEQSTSPAVADHDVAVSGRFAELVGRTTIAVNSTHHQAVARLGEGFEAEGRSPDGVVEVITHQTKRFVVGVQWHPELLADDVGHRLYGELVTQTQPQHRR